MPFYINSKDGITGIKILNDGGDYYVAEGLPGHWGTKAEGTTYGSSSSAQAVIDANNASQEAGGDYSGHLFGRSHLHVVEE